MKARWLWLVAAACGGGTTGPNIGGSVLEMHGAASRAGSYVAPNLTHAAASGMHLDTTFNATYNGLTYAQPLFVDLGGAAKDRFVSASEQNVVTAFDGTGALVWQRTDIGTPQPMPNAAEGANCGNINPLGITGTPVIDYATRTVYFDAMIRENNAAHHRVFALSLDDGTTLPNWPVDLGTLTYNNIPFTPATQNQRGALTLFGGRVYVPYGGHAGDCGDYHGWLVSIPTNDPQHPTAFATKDRFSGAWMPGGVSSDGTSVYAVFGNGEGNPAWGNSEMVGRFGAGATFSGDTKDFWVHPDWQQLDGSDLDMTGPAIPVELPGSTPAKLIVSFGKNGHVYLTDRDNMGGIIAPLADVQASVVEIINASASYRTAQGTYVVFRGHGVATCPGLTGGSSLVSVKIVPGAPPTLQVAWCAAAAQSGSPIATTTDGTSEPIVWAIGAESDQRLHGYDGDTGAVVYDGGGASDVMASTSRFITPIVAKGRIFVGGDGQLYAFAAN